MGVVSNCSAELVQRPPTIQLDIKTDQDIAEQLIWSTFQAIEYQDRIAPIVIWYEGKRLDCPGGHSFWGWAQEGNIIMRTCLLGEYVNSMHMAIVAILPGQKFSDTALAHEMCHAYFKDSNHSRCDESALDGPIQRANNLLKKIGR